MSFRRALLLGAAAGAAGTTALNAATYLDVALRARPANPALEGAVLHLADLAKVDIGADGEERDNRLAALEPLVGLLTGVAVGALYGVARDAGWCPRAVAAALSAAGAAVVGTRGPMTGVGVTDPRSWGAANWAGDVVPHVVYGAVTSLTFDAAMAGRRNALGR